MLKEVDWYERAMERLANYRYYIEAIVSLSYEIEAIENELEGVNSSSHFSLTPPSVTNYFDDKKPRLLDEKKEFESQIKILENKKRGVNHALNCLDEKDRDILTIVFIDEVEDGKKAVKDKYYMKDRTYYRRLNEAKDEFSKYYAGAC